ncbi:MAG TPA: hypothetical protein VF941_05475 [Clostridia bacterium]
MYGITTYTKPKKLWSKPRNIVRFLFIILWASVVTPILLKYHGYESRALAIQWTTGVIGLYIGSVSIVLASKSNSCSVRNLFEKIFLGIISVAGVIFFTLISVYSLKNVFCDAFITEPIIKTETVKERESAYKSYDKVQFIGEGGSYNAVPGYVRLENGGTYRVKIFINTRIAIGIEKE